MFESLRARLPMGGRRRRFVDIESVRDLEDISDPETTADESQTTVREWATMHPGYAAFLCILGILGAALVFRYTAELAASVLTSPWTWASVAALLVLGLTYRTGWRAHNKRVTEYDELHLKEGGDTTAYKGTYVNLPGSADAFIPIKGWAVGGHQPRPYANGELAAGLNESFDPWEIDDDKPAVIRLEPGENGDYIGITHTEWGGRKVVQETGGLEPDGNANHTSLYCTLPEFEDGRVDSLREQYEQVTQDYYDARADAEALRRENNNLRDKLNEPVEEEIETRLDQLSDMAAAGAVSRARGQQQQVPPRARDWSGTGSMAPSADEQAQQELAETEAELEDDDDDD